MAASTDTVLVYLGHPAHFHLFKETIKNLQEKFFHIIIVIKRKDVLEQLLKDSGFSYINISGNANKQKPKTSAYKNFILRLSRLAKIIYRSKPSLLMGSAAELALLGRLFNIPSYIFFEDDFEIVPSFAKIAGPFATKLVCPNCCSAWKWDHKKIGHDSYHELAYLHPNNFIPDGGKIKSVFNLNEKNFVLRFAQLTAYHDKGKSGITTAIAQKLIDILAAHGNVFITSERELEPQFEKYRIHISPLDIHHALYFADMYIGDSQTMTAEAAVLGTPAVRFNDFVGKLSYLEELEHKYHLTYGVKTDNPEKLVEKTRELLTVPDLKQEWKLRKNRMLNECIDLAEFMTTLVMEKKVR